MTVMECGWAAPLPPPPPALPWATSPGNRLQQGQEGRVPGSEATEG